MWAPVVVAACALTFTIASFWWLHARRGKLELHEPHTFAAAVREDLVLIRLPMVFYNTGAIPIIVQTLRLVFPEENAPLDYPWRNTRRQIRPEGDDFEDFPAVFAVPGRQVVQKFIEFGGPFPGFVPVGGNVVVGIEAKLGHAETWTRLLTFPLRMQHVTETGIYLAHSNSDIPCTPDAVKRANQLAQQLYDKVIRPREAAEPSGPPQRVTDQITPRHGWSPRR